MATRRRTNAENSQASASASLGLPSVWQRAFTVKSQWPEKDEFLDVIYWMRQVIAIVFGLIWGLVPLRGFLGIALFCALNAGILYIYFTSIQQVDEDEFGGPWELTKEGFMSSFALFLVVWIIVYSAVFFD
ncbi:GEL complex subunit OPTI-like [Diadema setosum]|uniref:GEL complex subunit OPTI-like n=1 Tax=Diadema antillarum TaxID=105358 RepID=UPI003A83DB63